MSYYNYNSGGPAPVQFQKAMIFVDGTNLFHRLNGEKLALQTNLVNILRPFVGGRQLIRTYLYTIQHHLEAAKKIHGPRITDDVRIVFGDGIPLKDGNVKEKCVDALLVADLIYHAAVRNFDFALIVSTDTDFVHALRRVEDFGCRTGVLCVCSDVPSRLKEVCDEDSILMSASLITNKWASLRH